MHPFTPDDIYRHRILGGLSGSTAHRRMVFRVTRALRGEERYRAVVWVLDRARGERPRRLTADTGSARSPMLSPDGARLAFLSTRGEGGRQVQLMPLDGGEARRLTDSRHALSTIEGWSPDGARLLLTATVACSEGPGQGDRAARERTRGSGDAADAPQVARFLPYKKDGTGAVVGKRVQLFAADVAGGALDALVAGDFDVHAGAWSPCGARLAYIRGRSGRQRHWKELWLADADGGRPRQRSSDLASVQKLAWSPDGRRLALIASKNEGSARAQLWLLDAEGDGAPRLLGGDDFELATASGIVWHPDGRRLAVICVHRGLQPLALVEADSGAVTRLRDGLRQAFGLAPCGDRLVYSATSMRWTDELYSVDWDGGDARRHSAFNRKWFRQRARPHVRKRRFVVPDGDGGRERIDAWLLLPPHGRPPYPLLVDAHGGPQSAALADFAMHAYWYSLLSEGWAVLAPNPVGSSGYGADFARRIRGHWGEVDFPQVEAILDALRREGLADARLAITGKSYGGYLAAWAIGHTDRFKAAIVAAPVANLLSHAGTSDTGYYVTPHAMGGELREVAARARALSPVAHCANATTPTLILQGEDDDRCPLGQAEELFAHLVRCSDAPAELVVYPGASHGLAESGKPSHRVDYHQRLCDWANRWVLGREDEDADAHGTRDEHSGAGPDQRRRPRHAA